MNQLQVWKKSCGDWASAKWKMIPWIVKEITCWLVAIGIFISWMIWGR